MWACHTSRSHAAPVVTRGDKGCITPWPFKQGECYVHTPHLHHAPETVGDDVNRSQSCGNKLNIGTIQDCTHRAMGLCSSETMLIVHGWAKTPKATCAPFQKDRASEMTMKIGRILSWLGPGLVPRVLRSISSDMERKTPNMSTIFDNDVNYPRQAPAPQSVVPHNNCQRSQGAVRPNSYGQRSVRLPSTSTR